MPDDLSKLTPTDPSAVDPDWTDKRQGILDGVFADTSPRRRHMGRWVAGVAAAALVAVAVGGVAQQFRPAPYATPAPSSPTTSGPTLLAATSLLLGQGDDVGVCVGVVMESFPPQCSTLPVTGITWEDVPWAKTAEGSLVDETISGTFWGEATIVGTFEGTSFAATDVFMPDDDAAPQPAADWETGDLPTLCDAPIKGTGSSSTEALTATAEKLPGYQALWVSRDQSTFSVAVVEDLEGARMAISEVFGGEVCVGTLDGPTDETLKTAQQALEPLATQPRTQEPTLDIPEAQIIWGSLSNVSSRGHRLGVSTLLETEEVLEQVQAAVGPEVWEYTDIIPFFYPVESTETPAPEPVSTPVANEPLVAAQDTLLDTGAGITLCNGTVLESRPPQCPDATPVTGITWDNVPWAETAQGITFAERTITVGTFDDEGRAFFATQVFRGDDPAAPQPSEQGSRANPGDVPEPAEQALRDAQQALKPLTRNLMTDPMTDDLVWSALISVSPFGSRLAVSVRRDTPALLNRIEAAVGPDVWPHTDVIPFFYPVKGSAIPASTTPPATAAPSLIAPMLVITDEERAWAAESVDSDLRDADDTSATATMAKATFGQYEALWEIDVPVPPGPPAGDTEVIVVTLSASLGNRAMRGPIGGHSDPATGTINVIDASTGESIIYATLLGEEPSTDRITDLPGPIEDVKLPEGFR